MKLIANENFQCKGFHRAGVTLTISRELLKEELEKGKKDSKRGKKWVSGIVEHCTPVNDETADFINSYSDKPVKPKKKKEDEKDDSEEVRAIRAEFDLLGKGYDRRWRLETLKRKLIKAKKETGEVKEVEKEEAIEG